MEYLGTGNHYNLPEKPFGGRVPQMLTRYAAVV